MAHNGKVCNSFEDRSFKPGLSVFPNADCAYRTCDGVPCGQPDIKLGDGAFRRDNWIRGWIITQLLTQARAQKCEVPAATQSLRGYWADSYRTMQFTSGSRLWMLAWRRSVSDTLAEAEQMANEALRALISWKIVDSVVAKASYVGKQTMNLDITVSGPSGDKSTVRLTGTTLPDMSWLWNYETGAF